jgi:hypothetical protein
LRRNSIVGIAVAAELLLTGGCAMFDQSTPPATPVATAVPAAAAAPTPATPAKSGPEVWDANRDGVYTCDEWKAYLGRIFDLADRNHDKKLDPTEFETVHKVGGDILADAEFGYFDENQDGKISREEFVNKPSEFILRNDRNGDCRVTPEEIKAAGAPKGPQGPQERKLDRFHSFGNGTPY